MSIDDDTDIDDLGEAIASLGDDDDLELDREDDEANDKDSAS